MAEELPLEGRPARPERADAARNRRRVLDAARRLFDAHGVSAVTMGDVAREAGVAKGTVFHRFGDRQGLAQALVDDAERALQDELLRGPPPSARARRLGAPARLPRRAARARRSSTATCCWRSTRPARPPASAPAPTARGSSTWRCCSPSSATSRTRAWPHMHSWRPWPPSCSITCRRTRAAAPTSCGPSSSTSRAASLQDAQTQPGERGARSSSGRWASRRRTGAGSSG